MAGTYRVVAGSATSELEIKKSRFIGAAARAASDDEARAFIAERRRTDWAANHHCSAYIIGEHGPTQRSSDDGEPSGTAGIPILTVLQKRELTDTVVVVTRYFGGTLLGAGGLIRAYGHTASAALDAAGVVERQPRLIVGVTVPHDVAGRVEHGLHVSPFNLQGIDYTEQVQFRLQATSAELPEIEAWLAATTNGAARPVVLAETLVEVPVSAIGGTNDG